MAGRCRREACWRALGPKCPAHARDTRSPGRTRRPSGVRRTRASRVSKRGDGRVLARTASGAAAPEPDARRFSCRADEPRNARTVAARTSHASPPREGRGDGAAQRERATGGRNGTGSKPQLAPSPARAPNSATLGSERAGKGTPSCPAASGRGRAASTCRAGAGCSTSPQRAARRPTSGTSGCQPDRRSCASQGSASKRPRSISGISSCATTDAALGSHMGAGSLATPSNDSADAEPADSSNQPAGSS